MARVVAVEVEEQVAWRRDPALMAAHLSRRVGVVDVEDDDGNVAAGVGAVELHPHTRLLGRKFRDAVAGRSPRQIWTLPPRHGKTTLASQWGPVWFLEMFPHKKVILGSYNDKLARMNGRAARNLMRAHKGDLFTQLSGDNKAADEWSTAEGGQLLAAGVGSSMTGFGADLLVIDDPLKNWEEASSASRRNDLWDWWTSTARTRLHKGGAIIVAATRWHPDDLSGRLLAADRRRVLAGRPPIWEHVWLPAVAEVDEADALGREPGEALCPAMFDLDDLAELAENDEQVWLALFQGRPTNPDGTVFRREWWARWWGRPEPHTLHRVTMSWDLAFKDRAGGRSWVVGQVWGQIGPTHYLLDQVRGRWDYTRTREELIRLWQVWSAGTMRPVTRVMIEDKANGPAILSDLAGVIPGLDPIEPQGSKIARAQAVSPLVKSGHVVIPADGLTPWVAEFVAEHADFPGGVHDDQVDATSQYLLNQGGQLGAALSSWRRAAPAR